MGYMDIYGSGATGNEYCKGFVDQHGQWNNGFYCPKWGGPERQYCCGPDEHKYCCPKEEVQQKMPDNQTQQISLLIGLAIGSFVLLMATFILSCYFCRCCWGYKRRKRLQGHGPSLPAYPGLPRDVTDPAVGYAVCPHGTIFPEFMVPPPRYPTEAPPPYPGHEPALPLEEKQPLPHPDIHICDGTAESESLTDPRNLDNSHIPTTTVYCELQEGCTQNEQVPIMNVSTDCYSTVGGTNPVVGCAVIPHDPVPEGHHHDDHRDSGPAMMPSTSSSSSSRRTRYQIPRYKVSHNHTRPKRHRAYDSRSISSTDSDSLTG